MRFTKGEKALIQAIVLDMTDQMSILPANRPEEYYLNIDRFCRRTGRRKSIAIRMIKTLAEKGVFYPVMVRDQMSNLVRFRQDFIEPMFPEWTDLKQYMRGYALASIRSLQEE